ncbi:hypothetical protein [Kingella potus]|uniref:hypothetical protein n=1 Tax=Kingella potus TaxID=265175 RepID=UPI001FD3993E|nr:hypothetical protein [Kingella potus]UOP00730.1 hypothetical protein LVJ84_13250 [Kingella potus]
MAWRRGRVGAAASKQRKHINRPSENLFRLWRSGFSDGLFACLYRQIPRRVCRTATHALPATTETPFETTSGGFGYAASVF